MKTNRRQFIGSIIAAAVLPTIKPDQPVHRVSFTYDGAPEDDVLIAEGPTLDAALDNLKAHVELACSDHWHEFEGMWEEWNEDFQTVRKVLSSGEREFECYHITGSCGGCDGFTVRVL